MKDLRIMPAGGGLALAFLLLALCLFLLPVGAEEIAETAAETAADTVADTDPTTETQCPSGSLPPSEPKTINVREYGAKANGITDDVPFITEAIRHLEDGDTLYFPRGTYLLREHGIPSVLLIEEKKDITVKMEKGAILQMSAVPDGSTGTQTRHYIFHFLRCENVTIQGGKLFGDRLLYTGTGFVQHGYGIRLADCRNVTVSGVEIAHMRGDGISVFSDTLDENELRGRCYDVTVEDCTIYNCQRNGITLTSVTGFTLRNTDISNIRGSLPEAAIDIEAEYPGSSNSDILIENCRFTQNGHWSITTSQSTDNLTVRDCLLTDRVNLGPEGKNIRFTNCEMGYVGVHSQGVRLENCNLTAVCLYEGLVTCTDCVFDGDGWITYRVLVTNQDKEGDGTFENCTFYGRGLSALGGCIVFCHTSPASLLFTDCEFESCGLIPFIGYLGNVARDGCFFRFGWALWVCIVAFLALVGFLIYRRKKRKRAARRRRKI